MNSKLILALILVIVAITAWIYPSIDEPSAVAQPVQAAPAPAPVLQADQQTGDLRPHVFDVSVHTVKELDELLDKVDSLVGKPSGAGQQPDIALVLHGPEIEFFDVRNYEQYQSIVDRAARLDAFGVIDVRMCQGMMQELGVEAGNVPGFIDLVPNGVEEVERLRSEGAVIF